MVVIDPPPAVPPDPPTWDGRYAYSTMSERLAAAAEAAADRAAGRRPEGPATAGVAGAARAAALAPAEAMAAVALTPGVGPAGAPRTPRMAVALPLPARARSRTAPSSPPPFADASASTATAAAAADIAEAAVAQAEAAIDALEAAAAADEEGDGCCEAPEATTPDCERTGSASTPGGGGSVSLFRVRQRRLELEASQHRLVARLRHLLTREASRVAADQKAGMDAAAKGAAVRAEREGLRTERARLDKELREVGRQLVAEDRLAMQEVSARASAPHVARAHALTR